MAGTVHTEAYRAVLRTLTEVRSAAGLSQAVLADRLGKPASFVGKYELGERRLDIVELMVILRALNLSFDAFWTQANVQLPDFL
ncbi:helix-turn-helix transcriptional regulator [Sulfitobacter sp. KE42]|uniref:helix-turn-helix domain-containing protein n=1 Tax=Sulfitobacter sp. KE42 TaxID=2731155 RepID=UPI0023E32385|nr:helix-turn-helix transcriptional regulator [Sulfitobacter sp. KE42]MDF3435214.1 helix-turn-helix transcriptional regulator [Sulfitobacter sp. KE42]